MLNKRKIFLISNFRFDSDKPFQKSRIKLVNWMDKIIDILNNNYKYRNVTFSGQSSFLEDYLEIRPELERDLKRLVSEKRIIAGPWYTLPNECLVSPESIIRNLMLGIMTAESFGNVMKVGYSINSYCLISQLPQILRGFDINALILNNENYKELKPKFIWYSADKQSYVLVINLCNSSIALNKDLDINKFADNIKNCNEDIIIYDACNEEKLDILNLIEYTNDNYNDIEIINGSFSDYMQNIKLSELSLEERYGEIESHTLSRIFSSRMYIKQINTETQLLIEKWLEPFSTLSWLETGKPYPKAFLWYAWKCLLRNHSYNNINECLTNESTHDNLIRYEWVRQIGEQLTHEALKELADNITSLPQNSFVIFNPLTYERSDPFNLRLITSENPEQIVVKSVNDEIVPSQLIKKEDGSLELSLQTKIPPLGYTCCYIETEKQTTTSYHAVKISPRMMENQFYRIRVNGNGTLDVLDKTTGYEYKGFNVYEDTEDPGDINPMSQKQAKVITSKSCKADIRIVNDGAIKAEAEIKLSMNLPKGLTKDRKSRTSSKLSCPIITKITLYTNYPRIDFVVSFENKVEDHCLRVYFPINLNVEVVNVDSHFDVLSRIIGPPKDKSDHSRYFYHQNLFIDVSDGKKGVAFINKGLPEYKIAKTKNGCILYLTLLKCVGSTRDTTSEAQCLGARKFYYSIIPHKGNWISAEIYRHAYEHNIPMMAIFAKQGNGILPKSQSFISVEPSQLIVTALKKCEFGDGIILRFFNPTDEDIEGIIKTHKPVSHACLINLNEQPLTDSELKVDNRDIFLKVNRKEIKTVRLIY